MRGALFVLSALVALGTSTSSVAAQCAPGLSITDATAGRCCWPAQRWDDETGRCEGPPLCPSGWGAHGDDCVRVETPDPSRPPSEATAAPTAEAPAAAPAGAAPPGSGAPWWAHRAGWEPERMHEERQPIRGLWVSGTIVLSLAYVYSLVVGSIFIDSSGCSEQNSWTMYIPFAGGFVWAATHEGYCSYGSSLGEALGIPASAVQLAGAVLLIIGLAARRTVRVPGPGPRVANGPGDVGLSLVWDL